MKKVQHNTWSTRSMSAQGNGVSLKVRVNNKLQKAKPKIKSVVGKVSNPKTVTKSKTKSKHLTSETPVLSATTQGSPVPSTGSPPVPVKQTAFADAMKKWCLSMITAINSFPEPGGDDLSQNQETTAMAETYVPGSHGTAAMALHRPSGVVGAGSSHVRFGQGRSMVDPNKAALDATHPDVELDATPDWSDDENGEEMLEVDQPPPPPPARPSPGTGAAVSAPQSALDLITQPPTQGRNFTCLLSKHVPDNIKRRIWANRVVDFAFLVHPEQFDDDTYEFVCSGNNNTLSLCKPKPKNKIDGWITWNRALRAFTEIYCMKYPNRCMPLLQYSGLLNNLSSKFPFDQVYAYDKEFRADLQWNPDKPWNVIDNQLWSMCLHGIHTLPHQGNPKQYNFKKTNRPSTGQQRGNSESNFKHCFDYNRGGCNRPSCVFPHICGKCGSTSHTIPYC